MHGHGRLIGSFPQIDTLRFGDTGGCRRASVYWKSVLQALGFTCHRLRFEEAGTAPIENLYARIGSEAPHFCFAGHTDVVPAGDGWSHDPFAADRGRRNFVWQGRCRHEIGHRRFHSRGKRAGDRSGGPVKGSISLLITGDEEGIGINGTAKMLRWLKEKGEKLDHCVVGEPTSSTHAGDTLKIGRRGSINFRLVVTGRARPCRLSAKSQESNSRPGAIDRPSFPITRWTRAMRISIHPAWPSPAWMWAMTPPM